MPVPAKVGAGQNYVLANYKGGLTGDQSLFCFEGRIVLAGPTRVAHMRVRVVSVSSLELPKARNDFADLSPEISTSDSSSYFRITSLGRGTGNKGSNGRLGGTTKTRSILLYPDLQRSE